MYHSFHMCSVYVRDLPNLEFMISEINYRLIKYKNECLKCPILLNEKGVVVGRYIKK